MGINRGASHSNKLNAFSSRKTSTGHVKIYDSLDIKGIRKKTAEQNAKARLAKFGGKSLISSIQVLATYILAMAGSQSSTSGYSEAMKDSDSDIIDIDAVVDGLYPLHVSHAGGEFDELLNWKSSMEDFLP